MEPVLNRLYGLLFTAVLLATPASGGPPVIATPHTATICDVSGCLMIPGYTVSDPEEDTLTYSYSATAALAGADIDPNTGQITATTALGDVTFDLTVTDSNSETDTKTITLTTFPDANPPTISGTFTASVAESAVAGTTVTTSYTASGGDTHDGVTYEISGTDAAFFKIGLFDGVLTTDATLDYETKSSLSVELTVKDSKRTASSPQSLTITVTDVDEAPVCNPDTITKNMADGATVGTQVVTLSCNDPDAGATIAYAIGTGDPNSYFSVSVGVITVAKVLDKATFASYALAVTATSNSKSGTVTVTVTVVDDEAPVCSPSTITKNMADDAKVGTEVTTLSCTDPESQALTYKFLDGNKDDDFAIDSSTGKITVDKVLDNSRTSLYVVKAAVADTMSLTATTTTTINVQAASGAINIANHMYIVAGLILLMKYHFE